MTHSLNYINGLNKLAGFDETSMNRIYWVVPVPGIWDEMSKELMKDAIKKAGIKYYQIISETTAAAYGFVNSQHKYLNKKKNRKFLVLDCNGATTDAGFVNIDSNMTVTELDYGDSISAGSLDIDNKFMSLLSELFGSDIIDMIKSKEAGAWVEQRHEFLTSRHSLPFDFSVVEYWNVGLCFRLQQKLSKMKKKKRKDPAYKLLQKQIKEFSVPNINYGEKNQIEKETNDVFGLGSGSNLKIKKKGWMYLHEETLSKIVSFCKALFLSYKCEDILLIGGFANSEFLQERLKCEFPEKRILNIRQPHLAMVKGALHYVHSDTTKDIVNKKTY
eukprot:382653_1